MSELPLKAAYQPSHDEAARQAFVGALKGYLNGPLEARLARRYEEELEPAFVAEHGRAPENREEGTAAAALPNILMTLAGGVIAPANTRPNLSGIYPTLTSI